MRLFSTLVIVAIAVSCISVTAAQDSPSANVSFKDGEPKPDETKTTVIVTLPNGATNGTVSIFASGDGKGCPTDVPSSVLGSAQISASGDKEVPLSPALSKVANICLNLTYQLNGKPASVTAPLQNVGGTTSDAGSPTTAAQAYNISLQPSTINKGYVVANSKLSELDFLPAKDKSVNVGTYANTACKDVSHWADVQNASGSYYVFNTLVLDQTTNKVASSTWQIYAPHATWFDGIKGLKAPHWGIDQVQGTRFYGARNIVIIALVVSAQQPNAISYTPQFTAATATNVSDFHALLGTLFTSKTGAPGANQPPQLFQGCAIIPVASKYRTSSIELDVNSNNGTTAAKGTFVNESNAWWDVSFAFPVTKASQLSYSSSNNTVSAASLSRQDLFAVADFFLPKADLKSSLALRYIPHPFAGVAISGKPLHNLLFGISMGTSLVEIYGGAQLVRTANLSGGLSAGSTATQSQVSAATSYSFVPSASFGIKVSIPSASKLLSSAVTK